MERWRTVVRFIVLVVCIAGPAKARAQSRPDAPHWEVSGAYTYLREPRTDLAFPYGWLAGGARRIGPVWATVDVDRSAARLPLLVGDARLTVTAVMVGARASARVGPFREFARFQAGRVRTHGVLFGIENDESRFAV